MSIAKELEEEIKKLEELRKELHKLLSLVKQRQHKAPSQGAQPTLYPHPSPQPRRPPLLPTPTAVEKEKERKTKHRREAPSPLPAPPSPHLMPCPPFCGHHGEEEKKEKHRHKAPFTTIRVTTPLSFREFEKIAEELRKKIWGGLHA